MATTMLAKYTCKGVILEVNLRECISHMPLSKSANKAAHSGFETQKSRTGILVAPKMDLCPLTLNTAAIKFGCHDQIFIELSIPLMCG